MALKLNGIFDILSSSMDMVDGDIQRAYFIDDEGDEVLLNDFDALTEAVKLGKKDRKLTLIMKFLIEKQSMCQKNEASRHKKNEDLTARRLKKVWNHYEKMNVRNSTNNFAEKICGHCAIKLTQENSNFFHACLEKQCPARYFCGSCAEFHPVDHVTLKSPHFLNEKPEKTACRALSILCPLLDSKPKAKLYSQKSKLNGDHLKIIFKLKYSGPANSKLQLHFRESVHEPALTIVDLPSSKQRKEKFTVECGLKLNKRIMQNSVDSTFLISSEWQLVKINEDGSTVDLIKLFDSTPLLIFGNSGAHVIERNQADFGSGETLQSVDESNCPEPFLQPLMETETLRDDEEPNHPNLFPQPPAETEALQTGEAPKCPEPFPPTDPSNDVECDESLCSLSSESSFRGVENGEEFADMFTSALLDRDGQSDVTAKGDCESFVENASFCGEALTDDSGAELINFSEVGSFSDVSNVDPCEDDQSDASPVNIAPLFELAEQAELATEISTSISCWNGPESKSVEICHFCMLGVRENSAEDQCMDSGENSTEKSISTKNDEISNKKHKNSAKTHEISTENPKVSTEREKILNEKEIFPETEEIFAETQEIFALAEGINAKNNVGSKTVKKFDPLVHESSNEINKEKLLQQTSNTSHGEHSRGHSMNGNDRFAEFWSNMLRETSRAFENVSVASSQAFSAVNEALEILQTSRAHVTPLPKPVISRHDRQRENSVNEITTPPPILHHVAWVPKGTQTLWDEAREKAGGPDAERTLTLSKSEKDFTEIVKKNRILTDMGFLDGAKNAQLLIQHNGDLKIVIDALLDMET